jgi:hypothetical protein
MLISLRRGNLARSLARSIGVAALALSVSAAARADFSVSGTFTPFGSGYFYNLDVTNSGADDLFLVSLFQTGVLASVTPSFAPTGFQISGSNDGVTGFIDLSPSLGSSAVFGAGTTVSGFGFVSDTLLFPGLETSGIDANGGSPTGTVTGITAAAPEPGTLALLAPALLAGALIVRRRMAR